MNTPSTILVVDDDAPGRAIMSLVLRQAGYAVRTASSGEEALKLLREHPCHWLITDARMRPMDGFELARQAKSLQPGLRIVMISALYTERDAAGLPIDKFFPKPVPVDELLGWLSGQPA